MTTQQAGPAPLVVVTTGAHQTRSVARAIAPLCVPGDVVLLVGDLGAGKTTFAQGFAKGLGITEPITSPTFTLVRPYPVGRPVTGGGGDRVRTLVHADLYRLDHLSDVADLALGELVEDGGVALVEWGDMAEPLLGQGSLSVQLVVAADDEEGRVLTISAAGPPWSGRWEALAGRLRPWLAAA